MSTLEELGLLSDDTQIEIPDEVPEESSGYVPLVQPGKYVFQLPDNLETIWVKVNSKKGPRIAAIFKRDNPLLVVDDKTFNGHYVGSPVTTIINNIEYPRGKERVKEVADMFYLIRAFEAGLPEAQKSKLSNNPAFAQALKKYAGRTFEATLHWEAYCNPKKNIFVSVIDDEGNRKVEEQEGQLGCEGSYTSYARDITSRIPVDSETGLFKERFDEIEVHGNPAGCQASLICNARLSRFTPVK